MLLQGIRILVLLAAILESGALLAIETVSSSDWPSFVDLAESSGIKFLHRSSATSSKFLLETALYIADPRPVHGERGG